uniref:Uncharacterized protein n=1 Tax=Rhizophora mucronata TaxID=61149 RepID=A0A2P2MND1_RHIMU
MNTPKDKSTQPI